jgi:hypothetical protein
MACFVLVVWEFLLFDNGKIMTKIFILCLALLGVLSPEIAFAAEAELSGANTSWILTSTALVLLMTLPGLALFYGGLVRKKKCAININAMFCDCLYLINIVVTGRLQFSVW